MNKFKILSIAVASAIVLPSTVFATNGMIPMGYGSKAKGMGGASIALPQEATAAANNPAGMVHIGNRIDLGMEVFFPMRNGEIEGNNHPMLPPGAANFRSDADNDHAFGIPEGGFNTMINETMSAGVSVVGVGGMNSNYDGIMMFNGQAYPKNTGINLMQLKIIPTVAYKFTENHSFGVGVEIGYQMFKAYGLEAFTGTNSMPTGNPGQYYDQQASSSPSNVTGSGYDSAFGIGFTLGWQGQITDQIALGATYHSQNYMQEFDDYKGLFAEDGDLDMPASYGFGISYTPTNKLTVAFDFTRTLYSGVDSISNEINSGMGGMEMFMPGTMLGDDNGSGFGWNDVNVYKLGLAYEVDDSWTVRTGWSHGDNPIDDDQTFFNLLAPGTVKDHFSVGATYTLENKSELTMHAYYALNNEVKGDGSIPAAFGGGEANIEMKQFAFGVQYGWNF